MGERGGTETRDSVADAWGARTPYGKGDWPVRVDERTLAEPERWVQSACLLCSTGCALDVGEREVLEHGPDRDLANQPFLRHQLGHRRLDRIGRDGHGEDLDAIELERPRAILVARRQHETQTGAIGDTADRDLARGGGNQVERRERRALLAAGDRQGAGGGQHGGHLLCTSRPHQRT